MNNAGAAESLDREAADEIERLREIEQLATHAGILKAQAEHNRMMAEKDAEIERLKKDSRKLRRLLTSILARHPRPPLTPSRDFAEEDLWKEAAKAAEAEEE
jgi:predicted RecB family endonuclease